MAHCLFLYLLASTTRRTRTINARQFYFESNFWSSATTGNCIYYVCHSIRYNSFHCLPVVNGTLKSQLSIYLIIESVRKSLRITIFCSPRIHTKYDVHFCQQLLFIYQLSYTVRNNIIFAIFTYHPSRTHRVDPSNPSEFHFFNTEPVSEFFNELSSIIVTKI